MSEGYNWISQLKKRKKKKKNLLGFQGKCHTCVLAQTLTVMFFFFSFSLVQFIVKLMSIKVETFFNTSEQSKLL